MSRSRSKYYDDYDDDYSRQERYIHRRQKKLKKYHDHHSIDRVEEEDANLYVEAQKDW